MGFAGSYEIVKRAAHEIKEERQRIAYMLFETEPDYQSQVDFGQFQFDRADGTTGKIYLFSMILGFSRSLYCEFVDRCDLPTFLDCHIRAFDHFGSVTEEILYDRMKNFEDQVAQFSRPKMAHFEETVDICATKMVLVFFLKLSKLVSKCVHQG